MEAGDNQDLSNLAAINAQSRRQAMDWSLVLASQDIHPVISKSEETNSWMLLISPSDYERALDSIKLYRLENRGWSWRRELPGSEFELHWGVVFWAVFLGLIHWTIDFAMPAWEARGVMSSALVRAGEWHRLFTAVLLHADLGHLFANISFGTLILGLSMGRYGWGIALLATYLAGVAGNLFGLALYHRPYTGLGASGMMMGALGLLCIHSIGLWRRSPKAARYILSGISAGFLLFVAFGVDPKSDILAHLGGFIGGLFFGALLGLIPPKNLDRPLFNYIAFATMVGLILLTWSRALLK